MNSLLMVLSKDPFTTEVPDLVIDIGMKAREKGSDVSIYLVEDGVTAARDTEFGKKIACARAAGIKIFADDKAVLSRGLEGKLIEGVEIKEIGKLLDFIMDEYDRTVWF